MCCCPYIIGATDIFTNIIGDEDLLSKRQDYPTIKAWRHIMEFAIKVLVVIILILIAFLIFLGMMTGWYTGMDKLTENMINFFKGLTSFNIPGQ